MTDEWEKTIRQWYRYKKSDQKLDEFFLNNISHFWKNLTLIEVIEIALKSKQAANNAYTDNYGKFRTFCQYTWRTEILDYRKFRNLTLEQFDLIQQTFDAKTIIFPGNIPRNILGHIYTGYHLIFYTSRKQYDGLPLLRPKNTSHRTVNLTINGSYNNYLTDPTNEILLTYQEIKTLTLNSICFTLDKVGILHSCRFYTLILNNCEIQGPCSKDLARCIVQRGQFLSDITIRYYNKNSLMKYVIQYIIEHIHKMHIYTLKISLEKTENSLKLLDNLKNATNNENLSLTIYVNRNQNFSNEEEIEDREFIKRLEYLKIFRVEIRTYRRKTLNWEENAWYF